MGAPSAGLIDTIHASGSREYRLEFHDAKLAPVWPSVERCFAFVREPCRSRALGAAKNKSPLLTRYRPRTALGNTVTPAYPDARSEPALWISGGNPLSPKFKSFRCPEAVEHSPVPEKVAPVRQRATSGLIASSVLQKPVSNGSTSAQGDRIDMVEGGIARARPCQRLA